MVPSPGKPTTRAPISSSLSSLASNSSISLDRRTKAHSAGLLRIRTPSARTAASFLGSAMTGCGQGLSPQSENIEGSALGMASGSGALSVMISA